MRKKLYIGMLMVALALVSGCSKNDGQEKGEENKTEVTSEKKSEKVTEKETEKVTEKKEETVVAEELIIKDGEKEIYGKIYKPAKDGEYPAIILSHGYNGCNSDFAKECRYYAENGYVAYAYDFWGLKLGKNFFTSIRDFYTFDNIGGFDKNVLIIHGDKDAIVSLNYSEQAKSKYPSLELVVLPGEGHGFTPNGGTTAMNKVLAFMKAQ